MPNKTQLSGSKHSFHAIHKNTTTNTNLSRLKQQLREIEQVFSNLNESTQAEYLAAISEAGKQLLTEEINRKLQENWTKEGRKYMESSRAPEDNNIFEEMMGRSPTN